MLTIDKALEYTHLGVVAQFVGDVESTLEYVLSDRWDLNSTQIDMRAEVAVLSRNIIIEGDDKVSVRQQFGAHILVHDPRTGFCLINAPSQ